MSFFSVTNKIKRAVSKISKITWVMIIGLSLTPEPTFQSYEPCCQDSSLLEIRRIRSWDHEIKDLTDQGWRSKIDNTSSMPILKHCSHVRWMTSVSHYWEKGWDTVVIFLFFLNFLEHTEHMFLKYRLYSFMILDESPFFSQLGMRKSLES